ncbi:c-type cytochrome [Spirosoma rhododendri]|uniref:C-type cytochrome n=1 Tax=Spirosoma rhododendri TaxID=2728024 RepID=A0A7L5DTL2_9BACT|nr:c-type cytochrome [Spirosoma rhododendri]QJD78900.1 c-type cytochrome [Spirosoma rhododendri]
MKLSNLVALTLVFGTALLTVSFSSKPAEPPTTAVRLPPDQALVKRGEYLVAIMGCGDCHSPKAMGPQGPEPVAGKALSGYPADRTLPAPNTDALKEWVLFNGDNTAAVGPWGVSFAANLTSDASGIGNWTRDQFKRALVQGKSKGIATNRMLLPPMPWPNYRTIKDADLDAIFAYLKSTKPVENVVPAPVPPRR